jgi:ribosomal protein S18 acetylase RimI-like enzyme
MDQITVRKATVQDMDTLFRFEQGVISAERPFDHTIITEPVRYYDLKEMISASHIELVVAELAGELIGSGYARIEKARHFFKHEYYAYLGFMYTDPKHRGKGVNRKIIDTLKAWAKSKNITELKLEVYADNIQAIKAYEKAGFTSNMIEMRIDI